MIQPGKNRWNAAFWCGTNAVLRFDALDQVGGVATGSVTEDIHTTLRLHRKGWRTVYHNEVLAYGLAARNSDEYLGQRSRWGTGAMQFIRSERPLTRPGLRIAQRLGYAATLLGWFDSWRTLGFLLLPLAVLVSGSEPIRANLVQFLVVFLLLTALQRLAMAALSRGFAPQGLATVFELVRLPATFASTLTLVSGKPRRFVVTPKGARSHERQRIPTLLSALVLLHVGALTFFAVVFTGGAPWSYRVPGVAMAAAVFATINLVLLLVACVRIRSPRFAGDRRRGERFSLTCSAELDGEKVEVIDVSLSGALLRGEDGLPVAGRRLVVHREGGKVTLAVSERSRRSISPVGTCLIGVEFDADQDAELAELSRMLFPTGTPIDVVRPAAVAA